MNAARLSRRQLLALSLLGCAGCRANNPTDPPNGPRFIDVSADAGLDYRWVIPGPRPLNILQSIGNGCAFLDFDNDGNLDILLVGPTLALFHNDGKGHFQNVTQQTGLD
ncbi:MAG TPA: VCBS repeat-containing protein, partial [Chthonomonas sp.]